MNTFSNEDKKLIAHRKYFDEILKLLNSRTFNNPLLLTGKKGIGKFTLIHHIISSVVDNVNYDSNLNLIKKNNKMFNVFEESIVKNLIYLSGEDKNVNIEKIRKTKENLTKSTINNSKRFIIFDDVELFNTNCLNALLKMIEEPSKINQFILINNKTKPLLDTVISRCLEIKIFINKSEQKKIITELNKIFNTESIIDTNNSDITPGNYLIFNEICITKKIDLKDDLFINIKKLVLLFKQFKEIKYINLLIFLIDNYYYHLSKKQNDIEKSNLKRLLMIKKINELNTLNLNTSNTLRDMEKNL